MKIQVCQKVEKVEKVENSDVCEHPPDLKKLEKLKIWRFRGHPGFPEPGGYPVCQKS